ncbi:MAG TPA: hypothetical protein VF984_07195 [Actinomycetota bacterium]
MSDRDLPLPETVTGEEMDPEASQEPTDWSATDYYGLLSVTVTVRSLYEPFSEAMRWHLEPFHRPEPPRGTPTIVEVWPRVDDEGDWSTGAWRDAEMLVYASDGQVQRIASAPSILEYALWDANAMVPRLARDFLFLHAGAVVRGDRAILIPALMDAGKSTTVAALLAAGFDYLSDELGAIDPVTSFAYPFEKLLSLDADAVRFIPGLEERLADRQGLSAQLRQRYVRPQDLGASVGRAAPVQALVFLEGDRTGPPRLERLSHAEAVHRMVNHCFNLTRFGDRGLVLLTRVAAAAVYSLAGGTPMQRAEILANEVA